VIRDRATGAGALLPARRGLRPALWSLIPLLALTACANPFAPTDLDYGVRTPAERVRTVERLDLSDARIRQSPEEALQEEILRFSAPDDPDAALEMTIEEARALTLRNNLDLRVSLINPELGAARVSQEEAAFEAVFFANARNTNTDQPTATQLAGSQINNTNIDAGVRIPTRTGGEVSVDFIFDRTSTNNQFATLDPSFQADTQLSLSHPLLRNAGRRATTHPLRIAAIQQNIDEARTKLEVVQRLAEVERAYWTLYAVRRALDVRLQEYEVAVEQLDRARRRFQAGADPEIEVIRAEEGVAQRVEAIILAQNDIDDAQRNLKRILNAADLPIGGATRIVTATDPDPVAYDFEPGPLVDAGLHNRMEMLEIELQLAVDRSLIDLRRNQLLPRLDATVTANFNGLGGTFSDALNQLDNGNFMDFTSTLALEVPIGNEGAESLLRQAVLTRLQRVVTRDNQRLIIEQEVRDAISRLQTDWRRVLAARQSAILAARTLRGEERQFEVGRQTSTEVLDAAARLADAQLAELRALTDYQIAQVNLAVATGTMLGASRVDWAPINATEGAIDETVEPRMPPGR